MAETVGDEITLADDIRFCVGLIIVAALYCGAFLLLTVLLGALAGCSK